MQDLIILGNGMAGMTAADRAIAINSVIDYLKSHSNLKVVTDLNE